MKNRLLDNERIKRASLYITAAALCVLILCVFFKIWRADLRVPFYYSGDSLFYTTFIKGMIDNGWYLQNPFVGAPGGLQMYDFPGIDNAVAVLVWLLSIFSHNAALVMNVFYLLTFPLITLTSLYVFRQFNLSYVPSLFCSLLYAFLPYHFMRNETHFPLSAYYPVPLAIMVVLWVSTDQLTLRSRKFILAALICVLTASSGIYYYPFFSCFLLLLAGAIAALRMKSLRPLGTAFVLIGITCATVVINLSPSLIYKYRHGDAEVVKRSPGEAERYGLKISQLLLPVTGHRIKRLDQIKRFHNESTLVTENDTASLGLVGSIGFLGLLAQLLHRKELVTAPTPGLFHDLSILNIFTVLLGIVGGFGFLFAVLVSSGIRSYNRISNFVAFFCLMAVAIGLERIHPKTQMGRIIFYAVMAVALLAALLDQTIPQYRPDYSGTRAEYLSDAEFVNHIETSVPPGAMIFQLPYVPFPEHPRVHEMADYDHFRGYLHSKNLRWSYGTMKNREGDRAQQLVAALPVEEFVQTLAFGGFSGIYVDRNGYEDRGAAKEAELSGVIQTKPLISSNGRLLFFSLADYTSRLHRQYSESAWREKEASSFHPLLLDWTGGFSGFESRPGKSWRWSASKGELHFNNTSQRPREIRLEMLFATGHEQIDDLILSGLISEQLKVSSQPTFYSKVITVPPGQAVIKFRCTAKQVDAPLDPRVLVFRVEDFKLTELD